MERLTNNIYSQAIEAAFGLLPIRIAERLRYVHFFTGTDPVYAGLHNYEAIGDRRSYRNTAHVCYPWNAIKGHGCTTIVLPQLEDAHPYVVIHELGHCLDELLDFGHTALPVSDYVKANRLEAFAEAFAAQYFWLGEEAEDRFQSDKETQNLFEALAAGEGTGR